MHSHAFDFGKTESFVGACRHAFEHGDRGLADELSYWASVPPQGRVALVDCLLRRFAGRIDRIELSPLTEADTERLSGPDGEFWTPLEPCGILHVWFAQPQAATSWIAYNSVPTGFHSGRYWINRRLSMGILPEVDEAKP